MIIPSNNIFIFVSRQGYNWSKRFGSWPKKNLEEFFDSDLIAFLSALMHLNPAGRVTPAEALQLQYFQSN